MSYSSPLLNHYAALLRTLGIHFDENAYAYSSSIGSDKQTPIVVEERRLVLPTEAIMRAPDWDKQVAFHPFSESKIRGQSQMIQWLNKRISLKLNMLVNIVVGKLIELCANADAQAGLTTGQLKIISELGDANDKTCENFEKLTKNIISGNTSWIHIYLRHSGKRGTETYARFAKVTFPIYEDLVGDKETIGGVRGLRAKDKKLLINILRYVFEHIEEDDGYSVGSSGTVQAPYYDALIRAYAGLAKAVNGVLYKFRKELGDVANARMAVDEFLETYPEAERMYDTIGALKFNIGEGGQNTGEGDLNPVNIKEEAKSTDVVNDLINKSAIGNDATSIANRFGLGAAAPAPVLGGGLTGLLTQPAPSPLGSLPRLGGTNAQSLGGGLTGQLTDSRPTLGAVLTGAVPGGLGTFGQPLTAGLGGGLGNALGGGLANQNAFNPLAGLPRK